MSLLSTLTSRVRFLPAIGWMFAIFVASSQRSIPRAPSLSAEVVAIAGHLIAYAILAALCAWGLADRSALSWRQRILVFTFAVVYGLSDEFHQSFVPGRDASVFDVLVDAMGAAIGLGLFHLYRRSREQRRAVA